MVPYSLTPEFSVAYGYRTCQLFSAEQAAELAQRWQTAKQEHMARSLSEN
jgi:hypothetical protein